ncbi:MAG: hypothetical protein K0R26_2056 [Bacteroidota bacterium]|jgi:hypothetical protein|nr:hypothetical protein [Bacteroidota bacterium]
MEKKVIDYTKINGWGVDHDPENEPTYPIKKYTGDDHQRKNWSRPPLQKTTVEILKSTERPYNTAVFGSVYPPKGLSGAIRRLAFKYSENMYRHWLPLLLADRIDVIEGLFGDIFHGRIPRLLHERGWGALWKFRPDLLIRKIIVRLLVLAAVVFLIIYLCREND